MKHELTIVMAIVCLAVLLAQIPLAFWLRRFKFLVWRAASLTARGDHASCAGTPIAVVAALALVMSADCARANGIDPIVVEGQASFVTQGSSLNITNSPGTVINWQGFSIGADETTRFIQQNASSSVLNRVLGSDPSAIFGTLISNGRVFLINPSGILFGQGSRIDVAGLVATTLNLSNQDFLTGRLNFAANPLAGRVENQGSITTPSGGSVYLVGSNVNNSGLINSPQGDVILAAGQSVKIFDSSTPGVRIELTASDNSAINLGEILAQSGEVGIYGAALRNSGIINADQVVRDASGKIVLRAQRDVTLEAGSRLSANGEEAGEITVQSETGTTLVSGTMEAKSTGAGQSGGTVQVLGDKVGLLGGQIDASGDGGGGTVLVGGDYQGNNPDVQNASATYMSADSTVCADAVTNGNGGQVVLWSDDSTRAYGSISAQGGAQSGDGGLIETSGHWLEVDGININASAARGKGGMWLLDPADVTITSSTSDGSFSGGDPDIFSPDPAASTATVNVSTIVTSLNAGTDVTIISANASGTGNGDITIGAAVTWTPGPTNPSTLTLDAVRDVNVNAAVTATDGSFVSIAGRDVNVNAAVTTTDGDVTAKAGNNVNVTAKITQTRGNLVLRADNDGTGPGTGGGTVVFTGPGTVTLETGTTASIYYNPTSYATPTDYTTYFTGVGVMTPFMWVFAQGNDKVYDGLTAASLSFMGDPTTGGTVTLNPGTADFDSKNAGTGKTVTYSGYSLGGADANKFALYYSDVPGTGTATAAITRLDTNVSGTRVYDATTEAQGTDLTTVSALIGTDVVSVTGTGSVVDKNVAANKAVTNLDLALTGADAGNYNLLAGGNTLTITKLGVTLTAPSVTKTYDSLLTYATTAGDLSSITLSGPLLGGDAVTAATIAYIDKNAGTGNRAVDLNAVTIDDGNAGDNYSVTLAGNTTSTITPLAITGDITADNKVYDANTSATILTRTLTGAIVGDVVSYTGGTATFSDKNVADGKTVTGTGLSLAGADAGNYTVNTTDTTLANITPLAITGDITADNKVYDANTSATILTRTLTGAIVGDIVSYSGGTATFSDKNVADGKTVTGTGLSLTGIDAGNYTVNTTDTTLANITPLAITGDITADNKVYDANTSASILTRTLTGALAGDVVSYTGGTATFDTKNVADGKTVTGTGLSLAGADAGNYTVNTTDTTLANITPLAITGDITADNKVYDANTSATILTRSLTGALAGDVVSYTGGTATFSDKNVADGKTVTGTGLSLTGTDAGNYAVNTTDTTLADITPLSITGDITADNKIYDANTSATIVTRTLTGAIVGDIVSYTGGTATFDTKNVADGKTVTGTGLSLTGIDAGNYTVNTTDTTLADITPLAIIGDITADNKVYDANTSATILTRSLTGAIAGDVVSYTGGTASFSDKNVADGKTVTGTGLSLAGADAGNYTVNTTDTTLANITPLAITGDITADNKVYDANTSATILTRSLTGALAGDTVSYTGGTATFSDKNVADGKTVTGTGLSLAGIDAGNYTVNTTDTTLANITPLTITGDITADNKVYDANTSATILIRSLTGALSGDVVSYSGGTATFSDKNVADGKTVTGTGLSLTGIDAGNYTVNTTDTTLADITPLAIIGDITADNKVYDANTSATIVTRTLTGALAGDVVSYTGGTATFSDKNVADGKTVTGTGLSLAGTDAGNYTVNSSAATTADITAKGLTGRITADNKIYDATTTATILSRTLTGVLGTDAVTYTGGSATFSDKNVAVNKTVTGTGLGLSGTDAGNYTVNSSATTLADITALGITGAITAADKVYDANNIAAISRRTLTGAMVGDDVSYSGGAASFDTKNVGADKTVTGTGLVLSGTDAGNYTVNSSAITTADITPLGITGRITADNKVYDATAGASIVTRTLTGVLATDVVSYTGGTASFDTRNVGTDKTVTGTGLGLSGTDAGNYTVNSSATTLADITALGITGAITAADKVYDANNIAIISTRTLTGAIVGDDVSYGGGTATFSDKNVADGKTVTGTGLGLAGADAGNYTVNSSAITTADITARGITGRITAADKVYDATPSATILTRTLTGALAGDTVSYTGGTATFSNKNVADGKTVTGTGLGLAGADAGNYTVNTTATTTADITARTMTLAAVTDNRIYNGTTSSTGVVTSIGLQAGDTLIGLSQSYASKDVLGTNLSTLKVNDGYTLNDGNGGLNYNIITMNGAAGTITSAELSVAANSQTKVYGTSDPNLIYTASGFQIGDTAESEMSGTLARAAGQNVGSYLINQNTLASSANYTVTYTGADLGITPAPLNVVADPQSKLFGTPDPSLTYSVTGLVNNPALGIADSTATVLSGNLTRVPGESALDGPYAITQGSLAANGNYTLGYAQNNLIIIGAAAEPVLGFNAGQVIFAGVINNEFYYRPGNFWHISLNPNNADPGFDVMRGTNDLTMRLSKRMDRCDSVSGGGYCETWSFPQQFEKVKQ